jgi:YggT family protein
MEIVRLLIYYALMAFNFVLLARVLLTWFPNIDTRNPLVQFVFSVTEPVLRPIRQLLPQTGMMDFSPLVVFLIISLLLQVVR